MAWELRLAMAQEDHQVMTPMTAKKTTLKNTGVSSVLHTNFLGIHGTQIEDNFQGDFPSLSHP